MLRDNRLHLLGLLTNLRITIDSTFRHDGGDAGVKGHLLVFRGDFAGGIEIIMNCFHGVHDFLALLSVVLPLKLKR